MVVGEIVIGFVDKKEWRLMCFPNLSTAPTFERKGHTIEPRMGVAGMFLFKVVRVLSCMAPPYFDELFLQLHES
jgi:hypothetical protein